MFKWFTKRNFNQDEIEILNFGLELSASHFMIPVQDSLRERFPDLTQKERDRYNKVCQSVLKFGLNQVYRLINQRGITLALDDLKPNMLKKFPWVSDTAMRGIIFLGIYITQK